MSNEPTSEDTDIHKMETDEKKCLLSSKKSVYESMMYSVCILGLISTLLHRNRFTYYRLQFG